MIEDKLKIKRARTLKQETPADRVIEEASDFDDSGSGYASDTPVGGKKNKRQANENFGQAVKGNLNFEPSENISLGLNSASQCNLKAMNY